MNDDPHPELVSVVDTLGKRFGVRMNRDVATTRTLIDVLLRVREATTFPLDVERRIQDWCDQQGLILLSEKHDALATLLYHATLWLDDSRKLEKIKTALR